MSRGPRRLLALIILGLVCALTQSSFSQIGELDTSFSVGPILNGANPGEIRAVSVRPDNSVIIAGAFTNVDGAPRGHIARLTTTGALDPAFASGAGADGPINAIAIDSAGKVIIGGEFQNVDGTPRSRIARLNQDGSLDPSFNPGSGANGPIYALAARGTNVFVAGDFTVFNTFNRNRLAKLTGTGSLDSTFSFGGPNAAIRTLYFIGAGAMYVGGDFTTWDGTPRKYLVALFEFTGSLLQSFSNASSGPNGPVLTIHATSSSPLLMVGGAFTTYHGAIRQHLALITTENSLDPFAFGTNGTVRAITPSPSNSFSRDNPIVAGDFTQINAFDRGRFLRLKLPSSRGYEIDASFHSGSGADGPVLAAGAQIDGKVVLAGKFNSIAGIVTGPVARLYGDAGSLPPNTPTGVIASAAGHTDIIVTWTPPANTNSYRLERSPDGVNGWTTAAESAPPVFDRNLTSDTTYFYRVAAINSNGAGVPSAPVSATTFTSPWTGAGALDPQSAAFPGIDGSIDVVAIRPDGRIVIAGSFTSIHGVPRKNVARLNPDWSVDLSFDPGSGPNSSVNALALDQDRIVIAGSFTEVGGTPRKRVARLLGNGQLDPTFDPGLGPDSPVSCIAVQPSGQVILGGSFSSFGSINRYSIVRLNADGTIDLTFQASVESSLSKLQTQRDGSLILGGSFFDVNSDDRRGFARLLPDGTSDPVFNSGSGVFGVSAIAALNSGKVLIAGSFTSVHGVPRFGIARLNADGTVDASFNSPLTATFIGIDSIAEQPNGKVIVGGSFTQFGAELRFRITRLNKDGSFDPTFQPGLGADSTVDAVAVGLDGNIILGGSFDKVGGVPQKGIARLIGDRNALPPETPAGLTVTTQSASKLRISWSDLSSEFFWKLERSPDGASDWSEIEVAPWDCTVFDDSVLLENTVYFYRLRAANDAGISDYSTVASGRTQTLYGQWKADLGFDVATPDDSDDDHDGVRLLVEYALGLDPWVPDPDGAPSGQVLGNFLALTYQRARSDLLYSVESSTDLINWTASDVSQGTGIFPIAFTPFNGAPAKFLRLRVSEP